MTMRALAVIFFALHSAADCEPSPFLEDAKILPPYFTAGVICGGINPRIDKPALAALITPLGATENDRVDACVSIVGDRFAWAQQQVTDGNECAVLNELIRLDAMPPEDAAERICAGRSRLFPREQTRRLLKPHVEELGSVTAAVDRCAINLGKIFEVYRESFINGD